MHKNTDRRYKHLQDLCKLIEKTCVPTHLVFDSITSLGVQEQRMIGGQPNEADEDTDHKSGRYPLCIACINWTRRLSKLDGLKKQFIPFDNVLLFIQDPGKYKEPDKRSLFRILQNISMIFNIQTDEEKNETIEIPNLYTHLCNFSTNFAVSIFRKKYYQTYVVDITKQMNRTATRDKVVNERMPIEYIGRARQRMLMANNSCIMNDIIRIFWEYNGTPEILKNRITAKYVRKMIRTERLKIHDMDTEMDLDED